jgi:hypothetical protein
LRNEAISAWEYEGSRRSGVWSMHALDRKEGGSLEREATKKGSKEEYVHWGKETRLNSRGKNDRYETWRTHPVATSKETRSRQKIQRSHTKITGYWRQL